MISTLDVLQHLSEYRSRSNLSATVYLYQETKALMPEVYDALERELEAGFITYSFTFRWAFLTEAGHRELERLRSLNNN